MMGTFAAALAKKRIRTTADRFQANVTGDIEALDGVLKIVRIRVDYDLSLPDDKTAEAQQAFETYITGCPAAQSVIGCIAIDHHLNLSGDLG
jgi:organic hydroperoxide reductase OsmC/OhrA